MIDLDSECRLHPSLKSRGRFSGLETILHVRLPLPCTTIMQCAVKSILTIMPPMSNPTHITPTSLLAERTLLNTYTTDSMGNSTSDTQTFDDSTNDPINSGDENDSCGRGAWPDSSSGGSTPSVVAYVASGSYNGHAFTATATVAGANGVPAASLEGVYPILVYYAGGTVSGLPSSGGPINVGTYTVVATFAGSKDYAAS